ncbi:hypothetical protein KFE25_012644 [Diacronema lutheri]|uniref:TLC domain-containing protein n=2 Tax=Diacronema lutheri TaxID=2081491 RepID=A0A8J6C7W5_DIALT|nr:hypothetical protein KFE25_012644 [Diacronema lutheri]
MLWFVATGAVASFATHQALRRTFALRRSLSPRQSDIAAHSAVCLAHNVAAAAAAAYITPLRALLLDGDARWHDILPGFAPLAGMSAGFFLFDLATIRHWVVFSPLMVAHHAVAAFCWTMSASVGFAQPWIGYCMLTELSSTFLSSRTLLTAIGDTRSAAYRAVSVAFLLSFLAVRTVPIPLLARTWLREPPIGTAACGPLRAAQWMGWMSALPLLLNAFWTVGITRKALAELRAALATNARTAD